LNGNSTTGVTTFEALGLVDEPLASLPLDRVRPPKAVLDEVMNALH
jgi:hypothetical protein